MSLSVTLDFLARSKSRILVVLDNGEQAALVIERGRLLRDQERVLLADGREVLIIAASEPLLEARTEDSLLLAKAAYHLGNRHVALQFIPGGLRFPEDRVLGQMAAGLGLEVHERLAPFDPEGGAYGAHAHIAHGVPDTPRPIIHSFGRS